MIRLSRPSVKKLKEKERQKESNIILNITNSRGMIETYNSNLHEEKANEIAVAYQLNHHFHHRLQKARSKQ
jgi:hypothetical protein